MNKILSLEKITCNKFYHNNSDIFSVQAYGGAKPCKNNNGTKGFCVLSFMCFGRYKEIGGDHHCYYQGGEVCCADT